MKVIILSDTHRAKNNMDKLVPYIKENVDMIIHAGDNFRDSVYLSNVCEKPSIAVAGNCDFDNVEEELIFELEGIKILLTHGHRHRVKYGIEFLVDYAKSKSVNIVIFGHTHKKEDRIIDGIQLINPGSLSLPRDGIDQSYVIMNIKNGVYDFEYRFL